MQVDNVQPWWQREGLEFIFMLRNYIVGSGTRLVGDEADIKSPAFWSYNFFPLPAAAYWGSCHSWTQFGNYCIEHNLFC